MNGSKELKAVVRKYIFYNQMISSFMNIIVTN